MITAPTLVIATLVLGIGTFAYRMVGPLLRTKVTLSPRMENLMAVSAVVLLAALVATSALIDGHEFAGFARPAGMAIGGLLAWRRAPFVLIVVAAAATAAGLRLLGVP